jgi:hypothetical protein
MESAVEWAINYRAMEIPSSGLSRMDSNKVTALTTGSPTMKPILESGKADSLTESASTLQKTSIKVIS